MRRTSTARPATRPPVAVRVVAQGVASPMPEGAVRRAVRTVLAGEARRAKGGGRRSAPTGHRVREVSVTFLSRPAMQRLNRTWLGHNRPTDVISFALAGPDQDLVGDVYVCPAVGRAEARRLGIPPREELTRLVIHGVLHLLGYDHPDGATRTASPMWRRQEHYVTGLA